MSQYIVCKFATLRKFSVLTLLLYITMLLNGCATGPMNYVPKNERVAIMAESQVADYTYGGAAPVSVDAMMANVKAKVDGKAVPDSVTSNTNTNNQQKVVTRSNYLPLADRYVTLTYSPEQTKPDIQQQHDLLRVMASLGEPYKYQLVISSGLPVGHAKHTPQAIHGLYLAEQRINILKKQLHAQVASVAADYNPNIPSKVIRLAFLIKQADRPRQIKLIEPHHEPTGNS